MHQCIKFILFWNDTIHVSDGLSVHHQELRNYIQQHAFIKQITAVCLLAGTRYQADSSICLTNACCCMYSLELLMMDGKTETCIVSFQNKINLIHWCIWRVLL